MGALAVESREPLEDASRVSWPWSCMFAWRSCGGLHSSHGLHDGLHDKQQCMSCYTVYDKQHTERADLDCIVWLQSMGVWVGCDEQHLLQISVEVVEIPHLRSQAGGHEMGRMVQQQLLPLSRVAAYGQLACRQRLLSKGMRL